MPKGINVNLYCDEIKETKIADKADGNQHWAYIGLLVVPAKLENKLISKLCDLRCGNPENTIGWDSCDTKCKFHKKNDKEIHYRKSQSADRYYIAKRWIENVNRDGINTFFYILGLNLDNLDYKCFGNNCPTKRFEIIYNRFFRTALLKSVKSFFYGYDNIIIDNIFHDIADISHHDYFPWHSIYRLEKDDSKISFNTKNIEFIDSDHNKSGDERSHLIQYIDIIMGAIFNALHWESKNEKKENLALAIYPLLKRMMENPKNKNSSYNNYYRKIIDFFPSKKLYEDEEFPLDGTFYKKRELRIDRKSQPLLF